MKQKIIYFAVLSVVFICIIIISHPKVATLPDGTLRVDFIDVGQGDSVLISLPSGKFILIDTGPSSAKRALDKHLESRGVKKLEMVIFTYPHENHIGNADDIIKKYDIGTLIMPPVHSNHPSYGYLLEEISYNGLDITAPKAGDTYSFGDATLTILSPAKSEYDNPNEFSVMTKVSFGNIDFILCSDNGVISQSEVLISRTDIKAEVLKVSDHASESGAIPAFISEVAPSYAVITRENGNSQAPPLNFTLELLESANAQILETSNGTVSFITDGKTLTVE